MSASVLKAGVRAAHHSVHYSPLTVLFGSICFISPKMILPVLGKQKEDLGQIIAPAAGA